jgi:hypothetical protein
MTAPSAVVASFVDIGGALHKDCAMTQKMIETR